MQIQMMCFQNEQTCCFEATNILYIPMPLENRDKWSTCCLKDEGNEYEIKETNLAMPPIYCYATKEQTTIEQSGQIAESGSQTRLPDAAVLPTMLYGWYVKRKSSMISQMQQWYTLN